MHLYAKILCPRHNLYEVCTEKFLNVNSTGLQKLDKNHLTCIKNDSSISVSNTDKIDIGSRHIIDACLNISINRGVYNAIFLILCEQEHKNWCGLQHYNNLLKLFSTVANV